MDNAMKFTKEFGTIKLVVKRRKSTYLFSIQDDGVGIGLDKLHLI
jgi:signal transduction histidine kinase